MKIYTLDYDFAGVQMSIQTTSIFELSKKLEEALEKKNLTPGSIVVRTEIVHQNPIVAKIESMSSVKDNKGFDVKLQQYPPFLP